jgi:hypothetical protein
VHGSSKRWCNPRDLGRQYLGRPDILETEGKFLPARIHQPRINLVVDKSIHLQDTIAQVLSFSQDPFLQRLHGGLPKVIVNSFQVILGNPSRFYIY